MEDYTTIHGTVVPYASEECLHDIECRLADATRRRNGCAHKSAARAHYTGVLATLRKEKRDATKVYDANMLSESRNAETLIRDYVKHVLVHEDVRKRGDEWCAYVDDKLTKKEKENNPKKYKGKKVGSVQRTKSGKIRMKARACYKSKKKANNAMAAAMMG